MIVNRGGKASDPRSVRRILQRAIDGAAPGALNAKAQFRGVLTPKDLDDLASYIAGAKGAAHSAPGANQAQSPRSAEIAGELERIRRIAFAAPGRG
jgi:hypothetical protein